MRAVVADQAGPPEVLRAVEMPDPECGPGQVRVAVEVAAITFIDTQMRAGTSVGPRASFPVVLGNGVGGAIDAVGDGVDETWLGTVVVTSTGGSGGYATRALAQVPDLHRVPEPLPLRDATALLADGRTAVGLHRAARIGAGDTVVVTAAAGGVGGLLVQLAAHAGARVIALAGDAAKVAHVHGLGAAAAVNYRDGGWPVQLGAVASGGVDVVFDGVGGDVTEALFAQVRAGGRYLQHGAAGGRWATIDQQEAAGRDITVVPLSAVGATPEDLFALVEEALALGAAGVVRPTIGQRFPLADAARAHAAIEARTTIGKTLLICA